MLQAPIELFGQNIFNTETYAQHNVGTLGVAQDGIRLFRYAKCGASDITAGYLQVAAARKTAHDNCAAYAAQSKGDKEITVTLGATAAAVSEYAEGWLIASDVSPEGIAVRIANHPAADASATLKLKLADELPEAVTTSSEFCLEHHPYMLIVEGTDEELVPAGVPLTDVDTSEEPYVWVQTRGPAPVLCDDGTATANIMAVSDNSQAGAVVGQSTTYSTGYAQRVVGYFLAAGVDTEFRPVFLTID
jgi:hypothetical protein